MDEEIFAGVYLDECLPFHLTESIRRSGWKATSAQEIRKIHISDVEQLCEATRRKLVLVTADKRTFLVDISEMKHTGIIILTKNVAIPEISRASQVIKNLLNRYTADEFLNAVFYVNH